MLWPRQAQAGHELCYPHCQDDIAQQLTLVHGFYDQYQYLPLVITCAENDAIAMVSLRHDTASASLGADDDLAYLIKRCREVWPNVRIRVRADCGFGNPTMYDICESVDVIYTFGQSANAVLLRETQGLLDEAVRRWKETYESRFHRDSMDSGIERERGRWHAGSS